MYEPAVASLIFISPKFSTPFSRSRGIHPIHIPASTSASFTARWWEGFGTLKNFDIASRPCFFWSGKSALHRGRVSRQPGLNVSPACITVSLIKPISNTALCAATGLPAQNSIKALTASAGAGASATIESSMPVISVIFSGMCTPGFTKVENLSVISPPLTTTAPISVSPPFLALMPVVSVSNITISSSRLWLLPE